MTRIPPMATGDFHGWTAAEDPEFHRHMDAVFGVSWLRMDSKTIRGFAKRWNFWRLYGGSTLNVHQTHGGTVEVQIDGTKIGQAIANALPAFLQTRPEPAEPTPPPPPPASSEGPPKADVWAAVPVDARTWNVGGLRAMQAAHGSMVTLVIPDEVMVAFARGFLDMLDTAGLAAEDTLHETVAEEYRVRPHAIDLAVALARHVINGRR